jgi:hypothetical protein
MKHPDLVGGFAQQKDADYDARGGCLADLPRDVEGSRRVDGSSMKRADIVGLIFAVLLFLGGLFGIGYWLFGDMITRGARVENLEAYAARVQEAATANRLAGPFKTDANARYHDPNNLAQDVKEFFAAGPWRNFAPGAGSAMFAAPVAVVDLDRQRYDEIRNDLPDGTRADTLEAARTIAFIRRYKTKTGSYGYILSHDAYKLDWNLLAVDMGAPTGPTILSVMWFDSHLPEKIDPRFKWFGDVVADRPANLSYYVVKSVEPNKNAGSR